MNCYILKVFFDEFDDNPARAFHGSYSGTATITGTETTTLGVYYNIKLSDNMIATSVARLSLILGGYKEGVAFLVGQIHTYITVILEQ
ncbi:hypothetical protein ACFSX9_00375 [Flavobacterium ardleyense]|uniref:Uncharacterized protein n=1 Tax=Flavobacterium ardleyense TaxID=2038737 RepID=A0ABW5Z428_9FLAO